MSTLIVPALDATPWPSLGPAVCGWIEENLCHGPGDLLGEPPKIDEETRAIIRRAYEVYPRGTAFEGRRRFSSVSLSLAKGSAKTEKAAWICIAEAHPDAPVRFAEWDTKDVPIGIGLVDPAIFLLATTEGQSETLTYDAVRAILQRSAVADDFEIGLGKITRLDGRGRIEAVATSPDARDGARTTWQCVDETHRLTDDRERRTYQVMMANLPKRKVADAWSLTTTTAFQPGQQSVAESIMDTAKQIAAGDLKDPSLFYFHRQADDGHDLDNEDEVREAVIEALGPSVSKWANVDGIVRFWAQPESDRSYFERVWLNRPVLTRSQIFDAQWVKRGIEVRGTPHPRDRSEISLGFDGSMTFDATALVGTELETGYQFVVGCWKRPQDVAEGERWEVSGDEVNQVFYDAMKRWRVKAAFCDRAFWETYVDLWAGRWPKVVVQFPTSQLKKTAYAVRDYVQAWKTEQVHYDGHADFAQHLLNARKKELTMKDEDGQPLYLMEKEAKNSPLKIDCAYAGCLSWAARAHAVQGGALKRGGSKAGRSTVYMG